MTDRSSDAPSEQPAELSSLRHSGAKPWSIADQGSELGIRGTLVAKDGRVRHDGDTDTMRTEVRVVAPREPNSGGIVRPIFRGAFTLLPTETNLHGPLSHVIDTSVTDSEAGRSVRLDLWSGREDLSGYTKKSARVVDEMHDDADRLVVDNAVRRADSLGPTELVIGTRDIRLAAMVAQRPGVGVVGGGLAARMFSGENLDATLAQAGIVNPGACDQVREASALGLSRLVREMGGSVDGPPAFVVAGGEIRYNRDDSRDIERIDAFLEAVPVSRLLDISVELRSRSGAVPIRPGHHLITQGHVELVLTAGPRPEAGASRVDDRRARAESMFASDPDAPVPAPAPVPEIPIVIDSRPTSAGDFDALFRPPTGPPGSIPGMVIGVAGRELDLGDDVDDEPVLPPPVVAPTIPRLLDRHLAAEPIDLSGWDDAMPVVAADAPDSAFRRIVDARLDDLRGRALDRGATFDAVSDMARERGESPEQILSWWHEPTDTLGGRPPREMLGNRTDEEALLTSVLQDSDKA